MKRSVSGKSNFSAKVLLNFNRTVCYIILGLLSVLCLFSFYFLIMNASRSHSQIVTDLSLVPGSSFFTNLNAMFAQENSSILRAMLNSLVISTFVALLTTYFSALTAYGIHAYNFKFKKTAFAIIMMIMMVPTQVSVLGFLKLVTGMGMRDTYLPLILPSIAAPVAFYFMKSYMESVLPLEIVEAARVDGSNEFWTFNRIVLPIIKPALAVQAIFAFVNSWNNFFVPALLINKEVNETLPIFIAKLRSADYASFNLSQIYISLFIAVVPLMIIYIFLSRFIIRGLTLGSVKG